MATITSTDTLISQLASMNQKITAQDVATATNQQDAYDAANEYVTSYAGTFTFLTNLHSQLVGRNQGLTDAQVAGVLNCMIAEYRRNATQAPVATTTNANTAQVVADGWYTIVGPQGGHRTLRIETVEEGSSKQWLAYLCGQDNEGDYKSIGFINGATVTLFRKYTGQYNDIVAAARFLIRNVANLDEYGRQYAIRSGKCYRCNRRLTTPESVAAGIGPICATK